MNVTAEFKNGRCVLRVVPVDEWEQLLVGAIAKGQKDMAATAAYRSAGHPTNRRCEALEIEVDAAPKDGGLVVRPSGQSVDPKEARADIARVLRHWLVVNERCLVERGDIVTPATHVRPTEWPDRGTLENWIAVLLA